MLISTERSVMSTQQHFYDVDRLFRVMRRIENDPTSFNMGNWAVDGPRCGTTACLAGHTVMAAGLADQMVWQVINTHNDKNSEWMRDGHSIADVALQLLVPVPDGFVDGDPRMRSQFCLDREAMYRIFMCTGAETPGALWYAIERHTNFVITHEQYTQWLDAERATEVTEVIKTELPARELVHA